MIDILKRAGFPPELREHFDMLQKAMSGNMQFVLTPATVAPAPSASGGWTRTVVVTVEDGSGNVHKWFNKTIASGVAIADTSTAGTATIPSTSLIFVDGRVTVVVTGDDASWADTETDTLTVAEATVMGYTLAAKTSVETFTA